MDHYFYITPEEYKIAELNGIGKHLLENRVRNLAWEKERAITEPPKKQSTPIPLEVREKARMNGIGHGTLRHRVHQKGWSYEKACTEPLFDRNDHISNLNKKYPDEILRLLEVNGIKYSTFANRINRSGWNIYDAATVPVMTSKEIGIMVHEKRSECL
jgi:hypothetical protein